MSVILEFTIAPEAFALGRGLGTQSDVRIDLERIIPLDGSLIPFFWVEGGDPEVLKASVKESPYIENLTALDTVDGRTLYRVEWTGEAAAEDLLEGIKENEATILEAHSNGRWEFRLRFLDHQQIADFYNYCTTNEISIDVGRVYTLTEESLQGRMFDLSQEQREALVLALRNGYFETPRETSMDALAAELGISQQAVSDRIRRGTNKVLSNALLP